MAVMLESDLAAPLRRGKVRDIYDFGEQLLIVTTDRVSAFDVVLPTGIPEKGCVLTQMSAYWFEATSTVVPNHMIRVIDSTDNPDLPLQLGPEYVGRSMLVRKAVPVKLEAVVRGYLAGSGWAEYQRTTRVCGIPLPPGLRESDALPQAIFTPSTKAEVGHDENITYRQAVAIVGEDVANTVKVRSMALYLFGLERARQAGFMLADTKFEFGVTKNEQGEDEVILIDEALTPDSSRYWDGSVYKPGQSQPSFDKQPLRDWLSSTGWNKEPPGPPISDEVVAVLTERYRAGVRARHGPRAAGGRLVAAPRHVLQSGHLRHPQADGQRSAGSDDSRRSPRAGLRGRLGGARRQVHRGLAGGRRRSRGATPRRADERSATGQSRHRGVPRRARRRRRGGARG